MTSLINISQNSTLGTSFTLNQSPITGNFVRSVNVSSGGYSGPTPEYWWRADSGLTTSTWTAYAGGLDFTLTGVSSANSTTGVYFDGTSTSFGLTANLASNIDAKHIFLRFDSLVKGASLVALTGGTVANIHEAPAYFNSGGFFWYYIEYATPSTLSYANRGTVDLATTAIWADFANGGTNITQYANADTIGYPHSAYVGTFNNRMRWANGYGIYIGRRHQGNNARFYLKEFAIFTTALTTSQGLAFRDDMLSRWP
jgi:hypothetical protein